MDTKKPEIRCVVEKGEFFNLFSEILTHAGYDVQKIKGMGRKLSIDTNGMYFALLRKESALDYISDGTLDCGLITGSMAIERALAQKKDWEMNHYFKKWDDNKSSSFFLREFRNPKQKGHFTFAASPEIARLPCAERQRAIRTVSSPYPTLARQQCERFGIDATVIKSEGSTELDVELGKADAIFDEVYSGDTIRHNGLETFLTYPDTELPLGHIPFIFAVNRKAYDNIDKYAIITQMAEDLDRVFRGIARGDIIVNADRGNGRGKAMPPHTNGNRSVKTILKGGKRFVLADKSRTPSIAQPSQEPNQGPTGR